jgi:hypothetical protein
MPEAKDGRPKCSARSKQSGKRCGNYPKSGGYTVCRFHGAGSPAAAKKAEERLAARDAAAAFAKISDNQEPVEDPLTELSKLATQVIAWKDTLATMVDELQKSYRYNGEYSDIIRGEVLLFERAMDRCIQVLAAIAKLNIDERLASISESVARQLEEGLLSAFDEAGLAITDADDKERVTRAFTRHLSVVTG